MSAIKKFNARFAQINDVLNAVNVLNWDQKANMPAAGSPTRAEQVATLIRIARDLIVSNETVDATHAAQAEITARLGSNITGADDAQMRAVEQALEAIAFHNRVPGDLVEARAAHSAVSNAAWTNARSTNDFASYAPFLKKSVKLAREYADAIGWEEHPYDALLGIYEPGITTANLSVLFDQLRAGLKPILDSAMARPERRTEFLTRHVTADAQKSFAQSVSKEFNFDFNRGRLDVSVHPFEVSFTRNDVRLTTRYNETFIPMAMFGTWHETGHGLYEQNIHEDYTRSVFTTDLIGLYAVGGTSFGMHESQSRLWENHVGRSQGFWKNHIRAIQKAIPGTYDDVTAQEFYEGVTNVNPGLIRVEADEMTYDFHIMLRAEIEKSMLDGSLDVDDIPAMWAQRMKSDLGQVVPSDTLGCLQDIHWSTGYMGSFPTYTVGNIIAAQLMETITNTQPEIISALESGNYQPLAAWLGQNVWQHGRRFGRDELLTRTTGRALDIKPYLNYLSGRYKG